MRERAERPDPPNKLECPKERAKGTPLSRMPGSPQYLGMRALQPGVAGRAYPVDRNQLLYLQRTAGNRAVVTRLTTAPPAASRWLRSPESIQRAIGFEFEFGKWDTTHADNGSRLDKGETIIKGDGYAIEGEDASDEEKSAIEVVTKPYTTVKEATASVAKAQDTLTKINAAKKLPVKARDYGGAANVNVVPGPGLGKMQASPAVALDKMAALYRLGTGAQFVSAVERHLGDKNIKKKYLGGADASPELTGFLLLILSYLEQGARKDRLFYPKSAFTIMARTSFTKMFSLVPEHDFFGNTKNIDKWVNLVMALSQRIFPSFREAEVPGKFQKKGLFGMGGYKVDDKNKLIPVKRERSIREISQEPVLGMPLEGMAPLNEDPEGTGYKSTVTREQWLEEMPQTDLLSKASDKRFEGMGAYGDAVDIEVVDEDTVVKQTEEAVDSTVSSEGVPEPTTEKGTAPEKEEEQPSKTPKQAPLFELRGMRDLFGIDQDVKLDEEWTAKVTEVFNLVDKANGESFKPGGKPTVAPDVDNPGIWKKS